VIHGEDTWQVDRSRSFIAALIPQLEREYNLVLLEGSGLRLPELENQLQFSLLGERKVIMIENLRLLKGKGKEDEEEVGNTKGAGEEESRWLEQLTHSDNILVLYFYQNIDKRKRFAKQVLAAATTVECPMLKRDDMIRAIQEFFQSHKLKADYGLVDAIVQISGSQLGVAEQEIAKLALVFSQDKPILLREAEKYLSPSAELNVFQLMEYVTGKKYAAALELLAEILRRGEEPFRLLGLLRYQLRQLVRVRQMQEAKYSENKMLESLGIGSYALRKTAGQAKVFSTDDLYDLLQTLVTTEEAMLNGWLDKVIALELLVAQIIAKVAKKG
jgi:DNA polymerase-3 subunit delta